MTDHPNRRKNRLFGMELDISVKWLLAIIVGGLIQFGVFWEQFRTLNNSVQEMRSDLHNSSVTAQTLIIKDATQDADIAEIKRRLNGHERRRGN